MSSSKRSEVESKGQIIGRWRLSKLIRKGRNTWIHEGIDIENNKVVALKFISKADKTWVAQQAKQIETEIQALQKIRHKHVIKLYAYNLDAKYPMKHDQYISCVLLVLEYASCGELFHLLYYTQGLNENISRTYFKQIIHGIELCHNKGIIHRDLRPKNILLNHNYNIKITNFHTSKIIKSDSDFLMKTKFIGSRAYQAPELLKNKSLYDFKCDIFSIGVILFILLAGYPPFEEATKRDKWYKPIIDKKYEKFWKAHKNVVISDAAKDLLNQMLSYSVKDRISLSDIKRHEWFGGLTLGKFTLQMAIQERYRISEQLRSKNIKSCTVINPQQLQKNTGIINDETPYKIILYPIYKNEFMDGGVYTFGYTNTRPIYDNISEIIASEEAQGSSRYDENENKLYCKMRPNVQNTEETEEDHISFSIEIYQSRIWLDRYKQSVLNDQDDILKNKEDIIYIVCMQRVDGDELLYRKIKNEFLLQTCSSIFKGLPKWAREMTPNTILSKYDTQLLINGYLKGLTVPTNVRQMLFDCMIDQDLINDVDDDEEDENGDGEDKYELTLNEIKW